MKRRLSLPVGPPGPPHLAPTVVQMRARLGGRLTHSPRYRAVVVATGAGMAPLQGVLLDESDDRQHVLTASGTVRTCSAASCSDLALTPLGLRPLLAALAAYGDLAEGDRVYYETGSGLALGTLREKCRWGALVEGDRGMVAVGFRRLSSVATLSAKSTAPGELN